MKTLSEKLGVDNIKTRISEEPVIADYVDVMDLNCIIKTRMMHHPQKPKITKLNKEEYYDNHTGEVKNFKRQELRIDNADTLRKTFSILKDVIRLNVTDPQKCLFVTLTYKEQTNDTKQIYKDFKKFNSRLYYYLNKQNRKHEYINVLEGHESGNYHMHCIFILNRKTFISNDKMQELWRNGFTSTKRIKGSVDDVGRYLSAYLTDIELTDESTLSPEELKTVKYKNDKAYLKGGRLKHYSAFTKIYRCSAGIKKPKYIRMPKEQADALLDAKGFSQPLYDTTINAYTDDNIYLNTFNYKVYKHIDKQKAT